MFAQIPGPSLSAATRCCPSPPCFPCPTFSSDRRNSAKRLARRLLSLTPQFTCLVYGSSKEADDAKGRFTHLDGDHLTLLNVFHAYLRLLEGSLVFQADSGGPSQTTVTESEVQAVSHGGRRSNTVLLRQLHQREVRLRSSHDRACYHSLPEA